MKIEISWSTDFSYAKSPQNRFFIWKLAQKNVIFSGKSSFFQGLPVWEIGSKIPKRIPWKAAWPVCWFLGKFLEFLSENLEAYFKPLPNRSRTGPGAVRERFGSGLEMSRFSDTRCHQRHVRAGYALHMNRRCLHALGSIAKWRHVVDFREYSVWSKNVLAQQFRLFLSTEIDSVNNFFCDDRWGMCVFHARKPVIHVMLWPYKSREVPRALIWHSGIRWENMSKPLPNRSRTGPGAVSERFGNSKFRVPSWSLTTSYLDRNVPQLLGKPPFYWNLSQRSFSDVSA